MSRTTLHAATLTIAMVSLLCAAAPILADEQTENRLRGELEQAQKHVEELEKLNRAIHLSNEKLMDDVKANQDQMLKHISKLESQIAELMQENKLATLKNAQLRADAGQSEALTREQRIKLLRLELDQLEGQSLDRKINVPITADFLDNRLENVIEYFRNVTGANINVNWVALEQAGVQRDRPVSLKLRQTPAVKVIKTVLANLKSKKPLGLAINGNVLLISTEDDLASRTTLVTHELKGIDATQAIAKIKTLAGQPRYWLAGTWKVEHTGDKLLVRTMLQVHQDVQQILQAMGEAEAKP